MSERPTHPPAPSSRAQREAVARAVLADVPACLAQPNGGPPTVSGRVLHASRSRPVVEWTVSRGSPAAPARRVVVGKVYGKGGGDAVYALLSCLWGAGFAEPPFAVPEPLAYLPERALLLQSAAPPRTLYEGIQQQAPPADVERTGAWLARLHAVTGTALEPLPPAFEANKAAEYVEALARLRPALEPPLGEVLSRVVPVLEGLSRGPLVPTHGDFQPKNVHISSDQVVVIDFDRAALAPPARDLGHFLGQALTMAAAARRGFDDLGRRWAAALVAGYLGAGGSEEAVRTTPPYVARTFLEVLFYRLVVRPAADLSFARCWVEECLTWLDRELATAA